MNALPVTCQRLQCDNTVLREADNSPLFQATGSTTMAKRRALLGVLNSFLGSIVSRNSDFEGYWLFGFLLDGERLPFILDLHGEPSEGVEFVRGKLERIATEGLSQQLHAYGFRHDSLHSATLQIEGIRTARQGTIWGPYDGEILSVSIIVDTMYGSRLEAKREIFVVKQSKFRGSRSNRWP